MLASVAIGVILSYPVVFMPDFPSIGSSGFPQHVWSGGVTTQDDRQRITDLEMRQVWLQGQYMQALDRSVLEHAFHLQDYLLGPNRQLSSVDSMTISPTLFWDNDVARLLDDPSPATTVNEFDGNASVFDMHVKPLACFAGKFTQQDQLTEADALVITLITRNTDDSGMSWDSRLADAAMDGSWTITAGTVGQSSIYEYLYQPLSFRQYYALAVAYCCMAFYTIASLRRLKAFRSRAGLVVTAITQMTTSILASFTICGLLRINLAQIPQEAYPFVVLTIGLENIFRLINAVIAYPPELPTNQRIANGLADVGLATMASAAQNLALLWLLSLFVSPGVAAFCAFASVALLFDYFFLITFFVAVLNVDIKRLELQDSITRPRSTVRGGRNVERQSWVDAAIHGRVPFSTRMAGSAVTVTFVMALNWHFSSDTISIFGREVPTSTSRILTHSLPVIAADRAGRVGNRTLNPSSWLQSRPSYATTAQFVHVLRPAFRSYTARIFDPVVFTINGTDRSEAPDTPDPILIAIRELAIRHFYPFALAVVFVVAFVTILMNFLLWNERVEAAESEMIVLDEGPLSSKTKPTSHRLDIALLVSSRTDDIVSVALDRTIHLTRRTASTMISPGLAQDAPGTAMSSGMWPIEACALGRQGNIAVLGQDGHLFTREQSFDTWSVTTVDMDDAAGVVLFEHVTRPGPTIDETALLHISGAGLLTDFDTSGNCTKIVLIEDDYGVSAAAILQPQGMDSTLITLTGLGLLIRCTWNTRRQCWSVSPPMRNHEKRSFIAATETDTASIVPVDDLGVFLVATQETALVIQSQSLRVLATISLDQARRATLRVAHSTALRCPHCDGRACLTFGIAYTSALDGRLVWTSYSFSSDGEGLQPVICMLQGTSSCPHKLPDPSTSDMLGPGKWETTALCCLAGIRRRASRFRPEAASITRRPKTPSALESRLRRRRRESASECAAATSDKNYWEAYILTHAGNYYSSPVKGLDETEGQLFTTELGPVTRSDHCTVAVAIGNSIVTVKVRYNPDSSTEEHWGGVNARDDTEASETRIRREGMTTQAATTAGLRRAGSRGRRGGSMLGMSRRRGGGTAG